VDEIRRRKTVTRFAFILALLAGLTGSIVLRGQNPEKYERFRSGGYLNGLGWIVMSSEEKSTYLLGLEDGIQTAAGQAASDAGLNPKLEDKVEAELLVRNRPGLDVSNEIDRIFKDDYNLRLPIPVAYAAVKLRTSGMREEGVQIFLKTMREPKK
jgi:hypothetical protein